MDVNILAVGDVCGQPGLDILKQRLRALRRQYGVRFCVVNGENANVVGITPKQADQILHAGADVEKQYVAGPYHPAFRELCENEIYKQSIASLLSPLPPGAYTLLVAPGHASKAAGQKRANLMHFQSYGYRLKIAETAGVSPFRPKVEN